MSNVIEFKKPPKPPEPKKPRPGQRKLLIILGVIVVFLAAWVYFYLTGSGAPAV